MSRLGALAAAMNSLGGVCTNHTFTDFDRAVIGDQLDRVEAKVNDVAQAYKQALTDPKLEAIKQLKGQIVQIAEAIESMQAKVDSMTITLEKLCASISNQSSPKHRRS